MTRVRRVITLCKSTCYTVTMWITLVAVLTFIASVESCNITYSGCMNGTCYTVSNEMVPWQNASERCKATCNGRLAVVENRETQVFLLNLTKSEVWLGGREVNLSDWVWIDQKREPATFSNWDNGQPETMNSEKFQPGVCLERKNGSGGNSMPFPWVDREYLWTAGVLCEADISRTVCNDTSSFIWAHTTRWGDIKEGKCVFISNGKATEYTWFEGHVLCQKADGELLKIDNGTVQQSLSDKLNGNSGSKYYWIGLVHSEWKWVTGTSIPSLFWKEFAQKEEIYRMEPACLALCGSVADVKKSWVMKKCVDSKSYICEYPKDNPMTTTLSSMTSDLTVTATMNMEEKDQVVAIAAGGAGLVIIIVLVVAMACWLRKRKAKRKYTKAGGDNANNMHVDYYNSVAAGNADSPNPRRDNRRNDKELVHSVGNSSIPARQTHIDSDELYDGIKTSYTIENADDDSKVHFDSKNVTDTAPRGGDHDSSADNADINNTDLHENLSFDTYSSVDDLMGPPSTITDRGDEPMYDSAVTNNNEAGDKNDVEDISQLYGKVNKIKKKKNTQQEDVNSNDISQVYAVIDKTKKKNRQQRADLSSEPQDEVEMMENDIYGF